jgi:uncharacterized protein
VKIVFVDAYNVINTWPNLKPIKTYSYEAARQKLIEILQNYATYKGYRVFIVFDAHKVQGNIGKKEKLGNIVIVYTKEGETADSFIEKTMDEIGKKVDVSVVTSDSLEQQLAFQRGATRMSSIEFYFEVEEVNKRIQKKSEKKFSEQRNLLEERVGKDILEKLEKIRRGR